MARGMGVVRVASGLGGFEVKKNSPGHRARGRCGSSMRSFSHLIRSNESIAPVGAICRIHVQQKLITKVRGASMSCASSSRQRTEAFRALKQRPLSLNKRNREPAKPGVRLESYICSRTMRRGETVVMASRLAVGRFYRGISDPMQLVTPP